MKNTIQTHEAPAAIGTYSQAIQSGNTVYFSGQVPLDPKTMELVVGDFRAQTVRVFENLKAVAEAAGGTLDDMVRLCIYLIDLKNFPMVNEVMAEFFKKPYPARSTLGVSSLPRGAAIEIDGIMVF